VKILFQLNQNLHYPQILHQQQVDHHIIEIVRFNFFLFFPKKSKILLGSSSTKDESSEENLIWKHEISPLIETLITAYKSIKLYLNEKKNISKNFFCFRKSF